MYVSTSTGTCSTYTGSSKFGLNLQYPYLTQMLVFSMKRPQLPQPKWAVCERFQHLDSNGTQPGQEHNSKSNQTPLLEHSYRSTRVKAILDIVGGP